MQYYANLLRNLARVLCLPRLTSPRGHFKPGEAAFFIMKLRTHKKLELIYWTTKLLFYFFTPKYTNTHCLYARTGVTTCQAPLQQRFPNQSDIPMWATNIISRTSNFILVVGFVIDERESWSVQRYLHLPACVCVLGSCRSLTIVMLDHHHRHHYNNQHRRHHNHVNRLISRSLTPC